MQVYNRGNEMKKESKTKLNMIPVLQTRNMLLGFVGFSAIMLALGGTMEAADRIKDNREFTKQHGVSKDVARETEKGVAKDIILVVVALAVSWAVANALRASKRNNDAAAIRVARRYIAQARAENPELKKYDYILNSEMALYNIAAGLVNITPVSLMGLAGEWDVFHWNTEEVKSGSVRELKYKNKSIQYVIDTLKTCAQKDPQFMNKLTSLVESSAKTFALDKYMADQKVR